ncbi:hypothetical protein [Agromyces rhizosphaerae]|uniref:hypothetical protein n=1 Tax=Agromyces rhizosphaerae TaxID=88374 RepID=UPI002490918F|nr:hypothetical protein [Agromyces rhizosphaerae]
MPRRLGGAALALASVALLAGCALDDVGLTGEGETCVSWVDFGTPEQAAGDADVVVLGTVAGRDGTERLFGLRASAWTVDVAELVKGPDTGDDALRVVSTPVTCTGGDAYPDGDPLDVDGEVYLFLTLDGGVLRTLTPTQGVVAPGPGGGIPPRWPSG